MSCHSDELRQVPLFSLLDDDELNILAQQVELRDFAANQRIYKAGDPNGPAYVMLSGTVSVTLIDEDGQEVIFRPRTALASSTVQGPWQITATGLLASKKARTNATA